MVYQKEAQVHYSSGPRSLRPGSLAGYGIFREQPGLWGAPEEAELAEDTAPGTGGGWASPRPRAL